MKIWKHVLAVTDEQQVRLPADANILAVATQNGVPCIWALVDPEKPLTDHRIYTHGTGHDVSPNAGRYVGSYQLHGGQLVFHIFEAMS